MSRMNFLLFGLIVISGLYWLWALACAIGFGRRRPACSGSAPPVSVLKPLQGDDGCLYGNLRSFCEQDYPKYQLLFGVRHRDDLAVAVVKRLIQEFPERDIQYVVCDRVCGTNPKVSNLVNLCRQANYGTLVIADSDIRVGPDYLSVVVAPLADQSIGVVTCLYKGIASAGLWSALGAMFINEWFFPSALVGVRLGPLRHAFGATIVCRRDTLASIGGFEVLADYLADDYMIGWLVSQQGLRVALSPYVVENIVVEKGLRSLFFHELRWTRTVRVVRPVSYFFSGVTYGIPLSFLFLVSSGANPLALTALAAHLVLRCAGRIVLYRRLGMAVPWSGAWLVPVRDVLSFILWALSFLGQSIRWNGHRFRVHADGRLCPVPGGANGPLAKGSARPAPLGDSGAPHTHTTGTEP